MMPIFTDGGVEQATGELVRVSIEHIELRGLWRMKLMASGVETKQLVGQDHKET